MNSEAVRKQVEPLMSEGLFGKRHIDKYVFAVPSPIFDKSLPEHAALAELGARAAKVAGSVELPEGSASSRHGGRCATRSLKMASPVRSRR